METEVLTDLTGEPDGGITPTFELNKDKRRVVVNDWVKAFTETLRADFEAEIRFGSHWFRDCLRSARWVDRKFTLMTEEEFKARFPLDG